MMIWTLLIVAIVLAITSDVSTMKLRRSRRQNELRNQSENNMGIISPKTLQMLYIEHKNNSQQNGNGESRKTIEQVSILHNTEQNLTLSYESDITKASDMKKFLRVDIDKTIENYKSTEKESNVQKEGARPLSRTEPARIQESGSFKPTGANIDSYSIISNENIFGMKIKNYKAEDNNHLNNFTSYPKIKITKSDHVRPEASPGIKILPHQNDDINKRKTYQFSLLDFFPDKKEQEILINPSRDYAHSNNYFIATRGVFPEEEFSQDVLTAVQKESLHGFPKGKNQQFIFKKDIESEPSTCNHTLETKSDLNPKMTAEGYDYTNINVQSTTEVVSVRNVENHVTTKKYTEPSLISVDDVKDTPVVIIQNNIKTRNIIETNPDLNPQIPSLENNTNNELQTTTNGEIYALNDEDSSITEKSIEPPMIFVDDSVEARVLLTEQRGKSNNESEAVTLQEKVKYTVTELMRSDINKIKDDIRIQNAKYEFSTAQKDGISDLIHNRTETRQEGKVTGSYAYSDGFFLRKVNYVADRNGYRIISEETVPLPGNGPKVNPDGTAHIKIDVGGHPLHYVVHGGELPQRASSHLAPKKACNVIQSIKIQ
nr:uncharacterized protein LOC106677373 isoform X2 [Halyomorpha halys]